jgi:hypothetical protein
MLKVVEHEQQPALLDPSRNALSHVSVRWLTEPDGSGDHGRHRIGIPEHTEIDEHRPIENADPTDAATMSARRVLPDPGAPTRVTSRVSGPSSSRLISARSPSRGTSREPATGNDPCGAPRRGAMPRRASTWQGRGKRTSRRGTWTHAVDISLAPGARSKSCRGWLAPRVRQALQGAELPVARVGVGEGERFAGRDAGQDGWEAAASSHQSRRAPSSRMASRNRASQARGSVPPISIAPANVSPIRPTASARAGILERRRASRQRGATATDCLKTRSTGAGRRHGRGKYASDLRRGAGRCGARTAYSSSLKAGSSGRGRRDMRPA